MNIHNILKGTSKTLRVANEVIPLYVDAKPLIKKTTNFINIFKNKSDQKVIHQEAKKEIKSTKKITTESNNPKFFK